LHFPLGPPRRHDATVARPVYPGYEATFNGKPVPLYLLDLTIPAVLPPPGAEGKLAPTARPTVEARTVGAGV